MPPYHVDQHNIDDWTRQAVALVIKPAVNIIIQWESCLTLNYVCFTSLSLGKGIHHIIKIQGSDQIWFNCHQWRGAGSPRGHIASESILSTWWKALLCSPQFVTGLTHVAGPRQCGFFVLFNLHWSICLIVALNQMTVWWKTFAPARTDEKYHLVFQLCGAF